MPSTTRGFQYLSVGCTDGLVAHDAARIPLPRHDGNVAYCFFTGGGFHLPVNASVSGE